MLPPQYTGKEALQQEIFPQYTHTWPAEQVTPPGHTAMVDTIEGASKKGGQWYLSQGGGRHQLGGVLVVYDMQVLLQCPSHKGDEGSGAAAHGASAPFGRLWYCCGE